MGSCCIKDKSVHDSSSIVPGEPAKAGSPPKGGVILVSARVDRSDPDPTTITMTTEQHQQPAISTSTSSNAPVTSSTQPPQPSPSADHLQPPGSGSSAPKLAERRRSGSQLLAEAQTRLEPRKVSRPSTPISRSDNGYRPPPTSHSPPLSSSPNGVSLSGSPSPNSNPLGWSVAPNAPNAPISLSTGAAIMPGELTVNVARSAARASRRRSAEQLSTLIPETIQEKISGRKEAAQAVDTVSDAPAKPPTSSSTLPAIAPTSDLARISRRSSGTFERMVTINKIKGLTPTTSNAGSESPVDMSHRDGGGRSKLAPKGHYELTDSQEKELKDKPYLWTDPHIWRYHINAVFTYYSTLPIRSSPSPASNTSNSSLPSIHHNDRIVWSQLQQLARDCIQRLYLLIRKDIKAEKSVADEKELEKKIWSKLEDILPGHGNRDQTLQWTSLYLLDGLAKTIAGSVGRREFVLLFPGVHQAMFCNPSDVVLKERKKLITACYKLKYETLCQPFTHAINPELLEPKPIEFETTNYSSLLGISHPMRTHISGASDRRRTMNTAGSSTGPSMKSIGDSLSRRGSFNASSVDRLIADLAPPPDTSRRGSRNLGTQQPSLTTAPSNEEKKEPTVSVQIPTGGSKRGSYRSTRERSPSP